MVMSKKLGISNYINNFDNFREARSRRFKNVSGMVAVNEDTALTYQYICYNMESFSELCGTRKYRVSTKIGKPNNISMFNKAVDDFVPMEVRFPLGKQYETII